MINEFTTRTATGLIRHIVSYKKLDGSFSLEEHITRFQMSFSESDIAK